MVRTALCALAIALGLLAAVQAQPGAIQGVITNPRLCAGVSAIRRVASPTRLRIVETKGQFDPATGKFTISPLAENEYDLRVYLKSGGWIDGAARLRLPENEKSPEPLTDNDRLALVKLIEDVPIHSHFSDCYRAVRIEGNGRVARVIVEEIRHRDYHSGKKGDIIWRVWVCKCEKHTAEWIKSQHGWYVLARERIPSTMPIEKFNTLTWLWDPALSEIEVVNGKPAPQIKYTIPERLDASMGMLPGSVQKQIAADRERRAKAAAEDGLEQ